MLLGRRSESAALDELMNDGSIQAGQRSPGRAGRRRDPCHRALESAGVAVAAGTAAFLVVLTALFLLERHTLDPVRRTTPRFPTPPTNPESTADRRYAKEEG